LARRLLVRYGAKGPQTFRRFFFWAAVNPWISLNVIDWLLSEGKVAPSGVPRRYVSILYHGLFFWVL
jgi:hypothetical protein